MKNLVIAIVLGLLIALLVLCASAFWYCLHEITQFPPVWISLSRFAMLLLGMVLCIGLPLGALFGTRSLLSRSK